MIKDILILQKREVDFVIYEKLKVEQLIQVCFGIKNLETRNREVRALLKAGDELKCKNLLVITDSYESEEKIEWFDIQSKVNFIPLRKWLLNRKNED